MDAKMKAIELVNRFKPFAHGYVGSEAIAENAKECALISVEEIREQLKNQYNKHYTEDYQLEIGYWCNSVEAQYWESVKKEITKL